MQLGVIFGGQSYEHEISIVSAITLKGQLRQNLVFVFCDKDRNFYQIDEKNMKAVYFSSGEYKKSKQLNLKNGGFYAEGMFSKTVIKVDVFINLIHGCDGEDGKISALFDFFEVAYIGPRIEASVMSYNKELTKFLCAQAGVKTLDYEVLKRGKKLNLALPVILKPLRLGSSIGISIVKKDSELEYGLDNAYEYDDVILAEPFIENVKEYNLAGCKVGEEFIYSIVEEPKKDKILDFEQKYMSFSGNSTVNEANLDQNLKTRLKEAFAKIYSCGFDGAVIRCDFFVDDNEIYLNEINPNPGSLAYYLFNGFEDMINLLAKNLPNRVRIPVSYKYIQSISAHK
ncbi:D-alanine--D-alanine ligase [Campylobacter geochelonis]|uniref:D-alanine--D-alanine ligase n=1 Tax=Campylobacter geochelonis TaxID=1780362 RepID=UPI0007707BC5|nr:D-alanine--D-alanine ligase [Campylobacter geochelonis]CZE48045.1 D-alanyl-alanine synthetase A [Campylobacter geochelonis]